MSPDRMMGVPLEEVCENSTIQKWGNAVGWSDIWNFLFYLPSLQISVAEVVLEVIGGSEAVVAGAVALVAKWEEGWY